MKEQKTQRVSTEEAIKRNQDKLLRIAVAIMNEKAEAEDAVHDAFIKLIEKQPDFESEEHLTAWLVRVTVNICKNRLHSHWWRKTVPLLESFPAQNEYQSEIMETVQSLPAKYRIVIHLFYYEGYSTKEIAEITEQSDAAVRKQLTRARGMLKKFLLEDDVNYERL